MSSEYEFFVDGVSYGVFDIKDGGSNGNYDDRVRMASGSTGRTGREAYWHRAALLAGGDALAGYDADTTVSGDTGTIYFTTDGSDPRRVGGAVNPAATAGNALTISSPVRIKARAFNGSEWSALTEADFIVAGDPPPGALVIPEIHYHPSLVLRDPYGRPDHADPHAWRASAYVGGSPGADGPPEPAFPAQPTGDDNTNGVPDLVDYAVAEPLSVDTAIVDSNRVVTVRYGQHLLADRVRIEVESTTNFLGWGSSTNDAPALEIHDGDRTVSYILLAPHPASPDPMRAFRLNLVE